MQNAGIAALGLNWRYLAFDVDPANLREALAGAKRMGFVGVNLTVPHKLLAVDMVDALDDSAKLLGAVNTIVFETRDKAGTWIPVGQSSQNPIKEIRSHGYNTDGEAFIRGIREDLALDLRGKGVVLLGAGGAGRVAAFKLAEAGVADLFLINRTERKAQELAVRIAEEHPGVSVKTSAQLGEEVRKWNPNVNVVHTYPASRFAALLVNSTSLGLNESDSLPLDQDQFPIYEADCVYDMIYRPAETPLLKAAKKAGCRTANGLGMLLYQGAKALEIWTGKPAPVEIMRRALEQNVYGPQQPES